MSAVTSNFSFSHSVFYLFAIFIPFEIVVCKLFSFGKVQNLSFGNGLKPKWLSNGALRAYQICIEHGGTLLNYKFIITVNNMEIKNGGAGLIFGLDKFLPRTDDSHIYDIHSSLFAHHCFYNDYVGKQPLAWKNIVRILVRETLGKHG